MDWLRKQSPLCDNYPLGKLSKKKQTPLLGKGCLLFFHLLFYNDAKILKSLKFSNLYHFIFAMLRIFHNILKTIDELVR